jgi:hypothetical protein
MTPMKALQIFKVSFCYQLNKHLACWQGVFFCQPFVFFPCLFKKTKVMKRLLIVFFVLFGVSCTSNYKEDIPDCIQEIIDNDISPVPIKTIQVQKIKGELHYWLNTDASHWDGGEFIVNNICDTVCVICGECFLPECYDDYDFSAWEIIWEKD